MGSGGSNGGAGGLFELAVMCKYVQGVLMLWIEEVFAWKQTTQGKMHSTYAKSKNPQDLHACPFVPSQCKILKPDKR